MIDSTNGHTPEPSRILSLSNGNGITDRQKAKHDGMNVTVAEMRAYTEAKMDDVSQWYMAQLPPMIGVMIGNAFAAYDKAKREEFAAVFAEFPDAENDPRMTLLFEKMCAMFGPRVAVPLAVETQSDTHDEATT